MTGFVAETPTFSANRRAAALLRRGVTNYMFALIKTLLGVEGRADDRVLPLGNSPLPSCSVSVFPTST